MAEQEYPTLNDVAPSWSDIQIKFPIYGGGEPATNDIAGINWSDSVEVGVKRGTNGGRKSGRTTGQYDCEASATFYKAGWMRFKGLLYARNPKISLVGFDVIIQHTPPESTGIYTVKIEGCRVLGRSEQMAEGSDADQIEITLNPMLITEFDADGNPIRLL